ncbi:leucine-rich repeat, immunoglobulin-like domain and transmembrane domain-containing protein 3 [Tenrec ecaudatus]|uniref:leucine-rich repeat, immunoglobulin-like domain and transmembrane domain-containing protein 3 n=1 Tax=Tenrec ecaudatus TaxID=94439 RepID=UPI003F5AA575
MHALVCLCVLLSLTEEVGCSCPSQCTCDDPDTQDGLGSRLVLCSDLDMNEVPKNLPVDAGKLRIEKTAIRAIPAEAFYYLVELRYLWVTCNPVTSIEPSSFYNLKRLHELRLASNSLAAFPWASLLEMPLLRTLDLHNNRITSVPTEATRYLKNLTYLDLSSNRLATLPPDFLDSWSHFSVQTASRSLDLTPRRIILGLQDNPWLCDCHVSKMIELSKVADPAVVLLDPLMVCSAPESLTGIVFQRVELEQCLKPSVMISATKITSAPGSNVLLRCDATGYPTPQLTWTRSGRWPVNYAVIQESPGEGVRWSIISLTGISYKDAGNYKCKAKNSAGISEAVVTVTVVGVVTSTISTETLDRTGDHPEQEFKSGSARTTSVPSSSPSPRSSSSLDSSTSVSTLSPHSSASFSLSPLTSSTGSWTTTLSTRISANGAVATRQPFQLQAEGTMNLKVEMDGNKPPPGSANKKKELALSDRTMPMETNATIENLRIVSETGESVTLTWHTINTTHDSAMTVLYAEDDEEDVHWRHVETSTTRVTLEGLEPGRQYTACVCPKGMSPQKEQCLTFSTHAAQGHFQGSILMVVGITACVLGVPLVCFLLYKVFTLQRRSEFFWEDDLAKETYIQFETLSPRSQSVGELWTRRHKDDSEKLLLCPGSSAESQMAI